MFKIKWLPAGCLHIVWGGFYATYTLAARILIFFHHRLALYWFNYLALYLHYCMWPFIVPKLSSVSRMTLIWACTRLAFFCQVEVCCLAQRGLGLNDFEKISYCDYFDWYRNYDLMCNIRGNDLFYIIILIFIEKHIKMIMVWFFAGICTKQRCFLKSVEYDV